MVSRLVLFVVAVAVVVARIPSATPFDPDTACCDHLFYRSMAFNLFRVTRPDLDTPPSGNVLWTMYRSDRLNHANGLARQPPFVYRPVTPLAARALSLWTGSIDDGFRALGVAALVGAGFVLGLLVLETTGRLLPAVLAPLIFGIPFATVRFNLSDYMLTDPLSFFFAALAALAVARRSRGTFLAACLVGAFNHESMLPMLACYPADEWLRDGRVRRSTLAWCAAIAAVYLVFRRALHVPAPIPLLAYAEGWKAVPRALSEASVVFGVLPLALWRFVGSRTALALLPYAATQTAATLIVNAYDGDRHIAQAMPFVVLTAVGVRTDRPWEWVLLLFAPVAYVLQHTRIGFMYMPASIIATILVAEYLLAVSWWRFGLPWRRPPAPRPAGRGDGDPVTPTRGAPTG